MPRKRNNTPIPTNYHPLSRPHSLFRPVKVSLWGNPEQVSPGGSEWRAQTRARRFFEANPDRRFYVEEITHAQLARRARAGLNGSIEHPRSHAWNTHRSAEIEGPGPHTLVFNRDWHIVSPWVGEFPQGKPPAGALLLPNVSLGSLLRSSSSAAEEGFAGFCWTMWEAETGLGATSEEAIPKVLQTAGELREAGLL